MNKNLLLGMLAGATFIFTGCQDEAILATTDGESQVTFTAEIPQGIATRTFADGTSATQLTYAVYETGSTTKLIDGTATFSGLKTTVNLRLVNGKTYDILFWAQDPDATCYDFDFTTQTVTVNYAGIKSSDETRDAFFKAQTFAVSGTLNETVQLYRPFSQLNIGATDYKEATKTGFTTTQTKVVVNHLANKINLSTGKVEGDQTITYDLANVPADDETFPAANVDADYLAMNYLLVPQNKQLVDVDFTATDGSHTIARHYDNVPVQRNYQTNIYGNILTEAANFNIEIVPAFTDSHAYPTVGYIQNGDTYEIFAPEGLQWLANEVNSNTETFAGKTVVLTADIDMEGKAFTPIGSLVSYPSKTFAGTFDGQNHTIYNLTTADYTPQYAVAGLFGSTTGTIKNVTLKNVNIRSSHYAGAIVAYSSAQGAVIENCHVDGGTVTSKAELIGSSYDNGDKAGGIAGYIVTGDKIDGCTVKNLTVQAYRDLGGIVGCSDGTVQNCTVGENVTIIVDNENNYKNYTQPAQYNANSIVGRELDNSTQSNNTGEANIVRPAAVATVATAAELKTILNTFGAAGAGSNVVEITNDIVLAAGETWTPVVVDGYHGADIIIINGNNHTIKGLDAPLFSGGFAGNSGIIIRDLSIIDSNMTSTNEQGAGCFIECVDSMDKIELTNCHVKNSSLTAGKSRVGGIIGWTSGYNNPNDGPVDTYVTIKNCSVIGCTIQTKGSVGGIYGHAGANPATFSTVENCTVQDCNLKSTDDGGWRVGVVVGTANVGQMTINNITESGNTLTQTGKTAPAHSNLYGRFVPDSTGKLTIDGVVITE